MAKQKMRLKIKGIPAAKIRKSIKLARVRARIGKRKA